MQRVVIRDMDYFKEKNPYIDTSSWDEEGVVIPTISSTGKAAVLFDPDGDKLELIPWSFLEEV